jgi:anti-sigma factor RsiW
MNEHDQIRLMEYLDGRLDERASAEVEALLANDEIARRLADEHRAAWELLGQLETPAEACRVPGFRDATVRAAHEETAASRPPIPMRTVALIAASLIVAVGFAIMRSAAPAWTKLSDEERMVVQNLDLLESLDVLETYRSELDLAVQVDILRAFEGEVGDER